MISESGEAMMKCPYDSTHMICEKFFSKHLMKCRKNHKLHKMVTCKFDKTHLIPKPELPHHLSICPSRCLLDRELQLKAATGAEGLHCGNVKGAEIIASYDALAEEEQWEPVPASGAPKGLFNRKDVDNEKDEWNEPHIIPGANYVSRAPRNAAKIPKEEPCRKLPVAPSKVAQVAEMSRKPTQPGSSSEMYLYSLNQAYSNPGFGRGRGIHQQQAVQTPGVPRPHQPDPVVSVSAGVSGSSYSNLPDTHKMEGSSRDDESNRLSQLNSMDNQDSNFTDASTAFLHSEDLKRDERKLRKKLKQIAALEQKSSAGILLTEEEKNKLQKKDEIMSLIESVSKHL
ncbi:hypothetical protein BsWGS_13823 [Bradybaena similaris]